MNEAKLFFLFASFAVSCSCSSFASPTIQWHDTSSGTYHDSGLDAVNDPSEPWVVATAPVLYGPSAGYFVYDFSSLADDVSSAALQFDVTSVMEDLSLLRLYDVLTPIEYLTSPHVTFGEEPGPDSGEIWQDLHGGVSYGQATVLRADVGSHVTFELNQAGIAAINAARGGLWAMAVAPESGSASSGTFDTPGNNYLSMQVVPEPSSYALMLCGAAVLFFAKRRKGARA